MYHLAPDQLERYRAAVASDATGPQLEAADRRRAEGQGGRHGIDALKTAPEGLPQGPSPGRAAAQQGAYGDEEWPRRGLAGHAGRQDPGRRGSCGPAGRCATGSTTTWGPPTMEARPGAGRSNPADQRRACRYPGGSWQSSTTPRPSRPNGSGAGPSRAPTRWTTTTPARRTTSSACTPTRAARPTRATSATTPSVTCWSASGPCRATPCSAPSASTASACRPRTPPSRPASTRGSSPTPASRS